MIADWFSQKIRAAMPFPASGQQSALIDALAAFAVSTDPQGLFLLQGYAGTGKTSVLAALVRALTEAGTPPVLLAPTGRAAKVLSAYAGAPAYTIHHTIYRQVNDTPGARFELSWNRYKQTLFLVDEASMIGEAGESNFGSGRLLDDLLQFVYNGSGCRLLLSGDEAQLPPVFCQRSPALRPQTFQTNWQVRSFQMTEVLRQAAESGILSNATAVRAALEGGPVRLGTYPDVIRVDGGNFMECLDQSYREVGETETLVVTRSNKRADLYAQGIRGRVLYRESLLSGGDLVMVVRNNYAVGKPYGVEFVANGDIAEVVRVRGGCEMYGLQFADALLRFDDYNVEMDVKVLLSSLTAPSPADLRTMSEQLFHAVEEDYLDIRDKRARYRKMRTDPYLTALQLKPAYALTCHKAQGGQWKHVYVDAGALTPDDLDEGGIKWLYTAFTRATERLYLIHFPEGFFTKET
ncbi:MAG: AAA family ATPase [Paludibacteraceae bacterium]|nr:AAA family ATPase [Paludibacteraceae bacterium]